MADESTVPKRTDYTYFLRILEQVNPSQEMTTREFVQWLRTLASYYGLGAGYNPSVFEETKPLSEWKKEIMEMF